MNRWNNYIFTILIEIFYRKNAIINSKYDILKLYNFHHMFSLSSAISASNWSLVACSKAIRSLS